MFLSILAFICCASPILEGMAVKKTKSKAKSKAKPEFLAACKTRLEPNKSQRAALMNHAGAARFAYNWGLSVRRAAYEADKTSLNAISLHKLLNSLKPTVYPWLYEISKCAPQEALRDLDKAYKSWWRRLSEGKRGKKAGAPHYKSRLRDGIGAFRLTGVIEVLEGGYVQLPRLGKIKLSEKDYLPLGSYAQAMISEKAGAWYVSVKALPQHKLGKPKGRAAKSKAGLDLGLSSFLTFDDGRKIEAPKPLRASLKKLRVLQRQQSRRKLDGANRKKTTQKIARLHAKVANQRQDFLHKLTTELTQTYAALSVESLNVAGMMQNKCLSRAVSDVGMGEFLRQLEYKSAWYGCRLLAADQWYPSTQICSNCHHRKEGSEKLTLKDRTYHCSHCGLTLDRDINAARNLVQLIPAKQQTLLRLKSLGRSQTPEGGRSAGTCRTKCETPLVDPGTVVATLA